MNRLIVVALKPKNRELQLRSKSILLLIKADLPIKKNTWRSTLIHKWKFTEVHRGDRTKAPGSSPSKDLSLNFIYVIRAALLHHFSLNVPFSSVSAFLVYQTPTSSQPWTRWLRTPCWDKLRHLLQSAMPGSAPAGAVRSESTPKPISINLFFISLMGITAMFTSCLLRIRRLNIFWHLTRLAEWSGCVGDDLLPLALVMCMKTAFRSFVLYIWNKIKWEI